MPFDRNPDGTIYQRRSAATPPTTAKAGAARLRRGRPHRPRDAAHAVPAERQVAHAVLRRVDGARPDPRRRRRRGRRHRALEMETGEVHILAAKTCCWPPAARAASSPPAPTPSSTPATAWAWRRAPASAAGHGVLAVPPDRRGRRRRAADRRLPRRGRDPAQRQRRALHGTLRADAEGPGAARLRQRCMDQEIRKGAAAVPNKDHVVLDMTTWAPRPSSSACPACSRSATTSPTSTSPRSRSPWCRPSTTRWAASRPTSTARWWRRRTANPTRVVNGLYAVGECSCVSVHGANRLGTNSLLDLSGVRPRGGNHIVDTLAQGAQALPADAADRSLARLARLDASTSGEYAQDVAGDIRKTMQSTPACSAPRRRWTRARGQDHRRSAERVRKSIALKDKSALQHRAHRGAEVENLIEAARATMVSAAAAQGMPRRAPVRTTSAGRRRPGASRSAATTPNG